MSFFYIIISYFLPQLWYRVVPERRARGLLIPSNKAELPGRLIGFTAFTSEARNSTLSDTCLSPGVHHRQSQIFVSTPPS